MNMAFYYLLCVGEHTKPKRRTRIVQFRVQDLLFWKNSKAISPMTDNDNELSGIEAGTLRISNQKNCVKNQTIRHEVLPAPKDSCPVEALVELVKDLRGRQDTKSTLTCSYKDNKE